MTVTLTPRTTPPIVKATIPRVRRAHVPVSALSLVGGLILWELIGRAARVPFFPPLSDVLRRLGEMIARGQILGNLTISLGNLTIGFFISLTLGVVIGTLMGRYWRVRAALGIYVYALLTSPSLVFAPVFFSILGAGRASIVGVVVMYSAFIMIVNTESAVRNVPRDMVEMARSYGANEFQIVTRIILPAALPSIFAGVRLGMGRAVTGMINGEMFISVVGLGRLVTQAGNSFDGAAVLAVLMVIIIVALVAVGLVQLVDQRLTRWVPNTSKEN